MGKAKAKSIPNAIPVARPTAPFDVRARRFLRKNPVLVTCAGLVVVSFLTIFLLSRGRALSGWASSAGFSYSEAKDYVLPDTFQGFDFATKGSTRYACNVMRGSVSVNGTDVSVTAFDWYYAGTSHFEDGEEYEDDNELSVIAFHLPQQDFRGLKIWPRKYLGGKYDEQTEQPGSGEPDPREGPQNAMLGDQTSPDAVEFDEGKETYLEYKARVRAEAKAAKTQDSTRVKDGHEASAAAPNSTATEVEPTPAEGAVEGAVEQAAEEQKEVSLQALEQLEAQAGEQAAAAQAAARAAARFDATHIPEAEDEGQAAVVLHPALKELLVARHAQGKASGCDLSFILDFVGEYLILYRDAQLGPEEFSSGINLGTQVLQNLPANITQAALELKALQAAAEDTEEPMEEAEEEMSHQELMDFARTWLREYVDEQRATKGIATLEEKYRNRLNTTLEGALEMLAQEDLTVEDVKAKYKELERYMEKVRGMLYDGGDITKEEYEGDEEDLDAEVARELSEDADF